MATVSVHRDGKAAEKAGKSEDLPFMLAFEVMVNPQARNRLGIFYFWGQQGVFE
jgi:hypothetical protein